MTNLTEDAIEQLAINTLKSLGYEYIYGPVLAPGGEVADRTSYEDVLLIERLRSAVRRINSGVSHVWQEEGIKEVERIHSPDVFSNNETFHRMLTEGIKVSGQKDGEERGDLVWVIDFDHPENNEFLVCNQFTVIENGNNKHLDVIVFVNGIPLVVMELKNPVGENANLKSAYNQLQTYKKTIPSLFIYNALMIISDGTESKAGSLSADFTRFMAWKSADGKKEASKFTGQLEVLIKGMLNKETLLDLIRHFVVFEKSKKVDANTGIVSISIAKIIAAYHQYYAVNRAVESTLRAAGYSVGLYCEEEKGNRKGGVVWHTQGSGKSLSMLFFTGKIVLALNNPTVLIITDRNDLDDQLFDTFSSSSHLLRQQPKQVKSSNDLKKSLKVSSGGIIFSTIQKFQTDNGNIYELLSSRDNIVVIADEAHRTQYGFKAKTVDVKDEQEKVVGKKVVYGFAKYMRDALPNATYLGFTGTPIESTDVNTPAVFGNYVDIYDIAQGVEDGAIVPIYYESRLAKVNLSDKGKEIVEDLDKKLEDEDLSDTQKAKGKWTKLEAIIGSGKRVEKIAADIVSHFEHRTESLIGKAMIVCMSRRIAVDLYCAIVRIKPEWHSDDLDKGAIKVVITSVSSDGPKIAVHHTTKQQRKLLARRMKDVKDVLSLVIVCDMWLTGFDVPSMHTMYLDKPMKGHNLMQAIARVNRVYKDKKGGLIVDYLGIASDLRKALSFYSESGGKGDPLVAQENAVELMLEKLDVVSSMFQGFSYEEYFDAETSKKLSIIRKALDHILSLEDGKKRYINEVTALSKTFAIAIPHQQAIDVRDEVSFFQAVKVRLQKFDTTRSGRSDDEIESAIRQVIDQALVSEKVIDIFDAAGIKKPNISILSEEFLLELKAMEHKNLSVEVLKKLLKDEIKSRCKNLVQSKSLMEMLENSIRKYQNKILTAAEVIEELIELSKEIVNMDSEARSLGFKEFEYEFYTAVADNKSARELMSNDKLRKLAIILTDRLKQNASIDWNIRESVRAKLRVIIKRTLREFNYPPDMRKIATDTVLQQAELLADDWCRATDTPHEN